MMIAGDGMIEDQVGQQLLERDHELQVLESTLTEATAGSGSVVVIAGNAGMGKSALVSEWTRRAGRTARILVGWCDDLATSRTLGPFHDIARHVGGDLAEAVAAGDIRRGLEALLQKLQNPLRPTVLIIEDVHWADDATLDVVRHLGRRIGPLPAVLVLTHRQDDIGSHHPLRAVLGVLPSRLVRRLELDPLSEDAVATLVRGTGLDGPATMELTGGNPFFVTELARSGGTTPVSVADATVARVQALTGPTRDALARLSVSPRPIPLDDALELVDADGLRIAEDRGFLVVVRGRIGFAHELARRAVLSSLTQVARMRHHAAHLEPSPGAVVAGTDRTRTPLRARSGGSRRHRGPRPGGSRGLDPAGGARRGPGPCGRARQGGTGRHVRARSRPRPLRGRCPFAGPRPSACRPGGGRPDRAGRAGGAVPRTRVVAPQQEPVQ